METTKTTTSNKKTFGSPLSRGRRPGRRFGEREKPEFDQKVINVRRVARVMAGGRRFSFSVVVVAGDRNGRVGVGIGKASDTSQAINKAYNKAKKEMIKIALTDTKSIPHDIEAKFKSAKISLRPAPGRGLIAGSSIRIILNLAGVKDINAKIISRGKNKLNIAQATMKALKAISKSKK
ncbi:MAG: 30S ribosomal protein S5 [Candidatus Paceibacterota bacterium]|jgi:small subunit ribosomal protein S5